MVTASTAIASPAADPGTVHPWAAAGAHHLRFGIETLAMPDWGATRAFVQAADDLGFDSLWLPDHPMVTGSATWTHLDSPGRLRHRHHAHPARPFGVLRPL